MTLVSAYEDLRDRAMQYASNCKKTCHQCPGLYNEEITEMIGNFEKKYEFDIKYSSSSEPDKSTHANSTEPCKKVWGPVFWKLFHLVSAAYADQHRKAYKQWIQDYKKLIPCTECQENFTSALREAGGAAMDGDGSDGDGSDGDGSEHDVHEHEIIPDEFAFGLSVRMHHNINTDASKKDRQSQDKSTDAIFIPCKQRYDRVEYINAIFDQGENRKKVSHEIECFKEIKVDGLTLHLFENDVDAMCWARDWLQKHGAMNTDMVCTIVTDIDDTFVRQCQDSGAYPMGLARDQYCIKKFPASGSGDDDYAWIRTPIRNLLYDLSKQNNDIIFLTSRSDDKEDMTLRQDTIKLVKLCDLDMKDDGNDLWMFPGKWASANHDAAFWLWKQTTRENIRRTHDCVMEIGDRYWDGMSRELAKKVCRKLRLMKHHPSMFTVIVDHSTAEDPATKRRRISIKLSDWLANCEKVK